MTKLLNKEFRLACSPLSWIFLVAVGMTLLPGYPILMGAFFVCFGVFHSFQNAREANDVLYTVLLPVRKRDFVGAKFAFTCCIQLIGFALMAALTALRMTVLSDGKPYVSNALMNATPLFLAFGIATLLLIIVGEALHFIPGLEFFNAPAGERLGLQLALLGIAAAIYALGTFASCRACMAKFEKIDL